MNNKTNIVLFGKNGQVGSNLMGLFAKENKLEDNFNIKAYSSLDIDFADLVALETFLTNLPKNLLSGPHFIINAAAYTSVDKAEDERELADLINHQAVAVIAKYCAKNNIVLIHYSTDYVFDGSGSEPFSEDNIKNLQPLNHYGHTKLLGEKAIINSSCQHIIFRISWVWDDNPSSKNFVNTIKKLAQEREVLSIVDDQIGSPTSASFVAENTIKVLKENLDSKTQLRNGIYHLSNEKFISWYDFAVKIVDDLRKSGEFLMVKEIKPIKTSEYKTKATRPLNSRLKTRNEII